MDFAKLVEQRDQFVADAAATLERRGIDPAAIKHPVDLQAEQAKRVRERIASLEARRADLLASIDTELAELKRDLKGREQAIATDAKAPDAPSVTGAPVIKKSGLTASPAPAKTRKASLTASPAPAKARKASLTAGPAPAKARATARPAARKKRTGPSKGK